MAARPRKRARVSKDKRSVPSPSSNSCPNLAHLLQSFDHKATTKLLLKAAKTNPSVAELIHREHSRQYGPDWIKVLKFDEFSKSTWELINVRYAKLSCARQFDLAPDAIAQIKRNIESICNGSRQHASYATKLNALEALYQITESIFCGTGLIGLEARKSFGKGRILVKAMVGILREMSIDHREHVKRVEWVKDLRELVALAEKRHVLQGLRDVVELLKEDGETVEEGEEADDEGEDESEETEESEEKEESEVSEFEDESEDEETREARQIEEVKTYLLARAIVDGSLV